MELEALNEQLVGCQEHVEKLNFQLEEAKFNNEMFKDFEDLVSRPSFQRIIAEGYCKEEVVRNTMWLSDIRSRVTANKDEALLGSDKKLDSRERIQEKLLSISHFNEWFNGLMKGTSQAGETIKRIEKEIGQYQAMITGISNDIAGLK